MRKVKTRTVFIVSISSPTGFHDRIISLKSTVSAAVSDGLRWYRQAASSPQIEPSVSVERAQLLEPR